jgi:hypothetical protein
MEKASRIRGRGAGMSRASIGLVLVLSACGGTTMMPDAGNTSDAGTDAMVIQVDSGPPADTWTNFGQGFFATYCVDCHNVSPKDFRLLSDVYAMAPAISCGVGTQVRAECPPFPPPRQFPIGSGPHPTDPERDRLVAWIMAGAPK